MQTCLRSISNDIPEGRTGFARWSARTIALATRKKSLRRPICRDLQLFFSPNSIAHEELAAVNWTSLPPLYQGSETYVHSLVPIFERGDYTRALVLAQEARDFSTVSEAFRAARPDGALSMPCRRVRVAGWDLEKA
jgi:hypothetical protein